MPISNDFLHILLYEQKKLIVFKLVDPDDVPEDVLNQLLFEFELEDPSVNLAEQADCLTLRDICSLEVFANPLLMGIILKEIDWFDVQRLREVSRDIRHCIDILKPEPHIAGYTIKIGNNSNNFENRILLQNGNEKCLTSPIETSQIDEDKRVICIEPVNHFKTHILHQKSRMDFLSLESVGNMFELVGDVLKSRDTPLRVKKFILYKQLVMTRANENDIMNILPYLDSLSVESIVNYYPVGHEPMNLAKVSKLVQWRNALELDMRNCTVENSIEELNIIDFRKIDIKIVILSTNDVIYLKENILKSVIFNKFEIKFENSSIDDSLYTSMPPYRRVPNNRKKGKEIEVEESMIHVFCEDLREILINRNTILDCLQVCDNSFETNTRNRIFECMKSALESRKEKLQVKSIRFNMFDQRQVMELLQFINPEILTNVHFHLSTFEDLTDYLVKWNRGCRLEVSYKCSSISTEILTSFKKMFNYPSVFSLIELEYEKRNGFENDQLVAFFDNLMPEFGKDSFAFEMENSSEFRLKQPPLLSLRDGLRLNGVFWNQLLEEKIGAQVDNFDMLLSIQAGRYTQEQAARLSLQDVRSLEVFANPLLMEIIAEEIDYFDIVRLRKVSRDIRSCIDYLKPDPHIAGYKIHVEYSNFPNRKRSYNFENRILLKNGNEKRITPLHGTFRNKKDMRVICAEVVNQFRINILHQKSIMDQLFLKPIRNLFELIGDVLKSRDTPLRVRKLILDEANRNDIMKILPYLDSVESIVNYFPEEQGPVNLNLSKVSKLGQWRNALELDMTNCTIENSIEELNIINFREVDIKIAILSTNDVIYLKENILKSPNFNKFEINFKDSSIDDSLYTSMPPYHRVPNNRSIWFFPMLNSNDFLHILLYEQKKLIIFKRVGRDSLPEDIFV